MRATLRPFVLWSLLIAGGVALPSPAFAADEGWPKVVQVEQQPLAAATERLLQALDYVGAPIAADDQRQLTAAMKGDDPVKAALEIQNVLDKYCVAGVVINPESRVSVVEGPAKKELVQQGWRTFLVKVQNQAGITAELKIESPNLLPIYMRGKGARQKPLTDEKLVDAADVPTRFLDAVMFNKQPLKPGLSGLELEYRIVQLFSRDVGRREAQLGFNVGQGTQDIGFRNAVPILFHSVPSVEVVLGIKDVDGTGTMASLVIKDKLGRVYPNPARRLAPDFFFHDQIYRQDGESVHLPPGDYTVTINRGPEYYVDTHLLHVTPDSVSQRAEFRLRRWIHAAERRWYSGDHHVHAAGCAHYDSPTEGVTPRDMMRHILGEDLNVGCVLSWGPCWYTQKQYFEGKVSALSTPQYLMRYDVEVSGFPSSHAGHLCLLRLTEDDYPGTQTLEDWPSWTQPVLAWGQQQGAVVGYSHSGWGLQLPDIMPDGSRQFTGRQGGANAGWTGKAADTLPDYAMPKFDGIGANEFIVTAPNGVCDFISAVDTPAIWELNIWYHTLNAGLRSRISGETDFPCIYGDKVGLGRIYVKIPEGEELTYEAWVQGVKDGRSYCGDGLSHIFDFAVNGMEVGTSKEGGRASQLSLTKPGKVQVTFDVAALLAEQPTPETEAIRNRRLDEKPYWHLERCRIGQTRKVPVEVIVNGEVAARKEFEADGSLQHHSFDVDVKQSSWIAVRILPSVHTNPVFVEVGGKPIRANKRSAQWCREAVDVCWKAKEGRIRDEEKAAARAAYDQAAAYYEKVIAETE
jgi:hypothetical protein